MSDDVFARPDTTGTWRLLGISRQVGDGLQHRPVAILGDHDLRPNAPNMRDDAPDRVGRVGLIEVAIKVVKKLNISNAQHLRSRQQLGRAELAERRRPWISAWLA